MVIRLTDFQVRLHLNHTFGYFDRRWNGWHEVEVSLNHDESDQNEIIFKVDQKINRGILHTGDLLWPDWAELKAKATTEITTNRRFYFNEAFFGLPPIGTLSRYAIDTLVKDNPGSEGTNEHDEGFVTKMGPFRGSMKSIRISSECACQIENAFGPKMIQIGSGVSIQSACDKNAMPLLSESIPSSCESKAGELPCGCEGFGTRLACYCPSGQSCSAKKTQGSESVRVGLLQSDHRMRGLTAEAYLTSKNEPQQPPPFLFENPSVYNQVDSCFANIFLCDKPVSYLFWMFITPSALKHGPNIIMKHASHWKSPWYMQISYNGPSKGLPDPEHIMKIAVEIRAPPDFTWRIDGCSNSLRVTPGQWHEVAILWNKINLTLFLDASVCAVTQFITLAVKATPDQRFGVRRTPFVFMGNHIVEDLKFNGAELNPTFYHTAQLANNRGEFKVAPVNTYKTFYAAFRLAKSKPPVSVQLPGVNAVVTNVDRAIVVKSNQQCSVFELPVICIIGDSCNMEVERQGSRIFVYSQNLQLSTVDDWSLCNTDQLHATEAGLVPNSEIRLFNLGRKELLDRQLIKTTHFPNLICNFDSLRPLSNRLPLSLAGACSIVEAFPSIQILSYNGFPKSPINGTLITTTSRLKLHSLANTPESRCLLDLEMCQYGLTLTFWMMSLSVTPKIGPILQQVGSSGSNLTVSLERSDNQYRLETIVRSLQMITTGKAVSKLWTVKVGINSTIGLWTLVTISWSYTAGLSVKVNSLLVGAMAEPYEERSDWTFSNKEGLWFGHYGEPVMENGVVIDDFQFIPSELNYLAFVGQAIDVKLSNNETKPCRRATCLNEFSCYPNQHNSSSSGEFCHCDLPWRFCKELPMVLDIQKSMDIINSPITSPPLLQTQHTPSSWPSVSTSVLPAARTPPILFKHISNMNQSLVKQSRINELDTLGPRSASPSGIISKCNPPCQNGGKCRLSTIDGEFTCLCSEVPFWGNACTREHVGWLSENDEVLGSKSNRQVFVTHKAAYGQTKQRFIFRALVPEDSAFTRFRRFRKSVSEPLFGEHTALLTVTGEPITFGLIMNSSSLFLVTRDDKISQVQIIPCIQSPKLNLNDGALHVVQMEHRGDFLRLKVDSIAVYPTKVLPHACDKWLFFGLAIHMKNGTYDETTVPESKKADLEFGNAVLGAWPSGEGEFKGAIGGWMVDDEEMIMPAINEADDTPNTVYRLGANYSLSNGKFVWIRLQSLTPVSVLSDTVSTLPTITFFWLLGCIGLGLLLLLFICGVSLCFCRHRKAVYRRNRVAKIKPLASAVQFSSDHPVYPVEGRFKTFSDCKSLSDTSSKLCLLKYQTSNNIAQPMTKDNLRIKPTLTIQSPSHNIDNLASLNATSISILCLYDDTDDIENIIVTPDGNSVITLATNHGISVKQWNTFDGSYCKQIVAKPTGPGIIAFHERNGLLLADEYNNAQLYPLNLGFSSAAVQLPLTVWEVFAFGDLFLFVTASKADVTKDSLAALYFWSPGFKVIMAQNRLRIPKGNLPENANRLQPLLGPNEENLLLRWLCPGFDDRSFSITVNLSAVSKELRMSTEPLINLNSNISAKLIRHSINLSKTTFLTADIAVTGDTRGVLHIWDIRSGLIYRSVQSNPTPLSGPFHANLVQYDFSHLTLDSDASPITALAVTEPTLTEAGNITWLCSGDNSGCAVVRHCLTTASGSSNKIITRIRAKFSPSPLSANAITCARLLSCLQWQTKELGAFLGIGDSSGCIRIWLLPQCIQLAQLVSSDGFGLTDLVLMQPRFSTVLQNPLVQVVGLMRSDRRLDSSDDHGCVVIIHLNARDERCAHNDMHSLQTGFEHKKLP